MSPNSTYNHIPGEDLRGCHIIDTHSTRGPRPFGFFLAYETCVALGKAIFVDHLPPAEVQRLTGVSRRTVYRFRKKLPLLSSKCRCGKDYGHAGFCLGHRKMTSVGKGLGGRQTTATGQYYLPLNEWDLATPTETVLMKPKRQCLRCNRVWVQKVAFEQKPRQCPQCRSRRWDTPRVHRGYGDPSGLRGESLRPARRVKPEGVTSTRLKEVFDVCQEEA